MQLTFEIQLQDDQEMIFQNNNTDLRRIVVRKFELWAPQLHFTGKGETLVNDQPNGNTSMKLCVAAAPEGMQMVRG